MARSTEGMPSTSAAPVPTSPPAVWYRGSGLYMRSEDLRPSMCTVATTTSKYLGEEEVVSHTRVKYAQWICTARQSKFHLLEWKPSHTY